MFRASNFSFLLPKQNRLNIRCGFVALKKTGRMINSNSFGLLYSKGDGVHSRFNFIVSTKISKKAVERNLIKRRLREIVRKILPEFEKRHIQGVFLVKKPAQNKTYEELKIEVDNIINKL